MSFNPTHEVVRNGETLPAEALATSSEFYINNNPSPLITLMDREGVLFYSNSPGVESVTPLGTLVLSEDGKRFLVSKRTATPPWMPRPGDQVRVKHPSKTNWSGADRGEIVSHEGTGFYIVKFDYGTVSGVSRGNMKKASLQIEKEAKPPWMPRPGDRVVSNGHPGEVVSKDFSGFYTIKFDDGLTVSEVSRDTMKKGRAKRTASLFEKTAETTWETDEVQRWAANTESLYWALKDASDSFAAEQIIREFASTDPYFDVEWSEVDWDEVWSDFSELTSESRKTAGGDGPYTDHSTPQGEVAFDDISMSAEDPNLIDVQGDETVDDGTDYMVAQKEAATPYGGFLITHEWDDGEIRPTEVYGPRDISDEFRSLLKGGSGRACQLWDDDGELMARGRWVEYGGSDPLADYGMGMFGATRMTVGNTQPFIGHRKNERLLGLDGFWEAI